MPLIQKYLQNVLVAQVIALRKLIPTLDDLLYAKSHPWGACKLQQRHLDQPRIMDEKQQLRALESQQSPPRYSQVFDLSESAQLDGVETRPQRSNLKLILFAMISYLFISSWCSPANSANDVNGWETEEAAYKVLYNGTGYVVREYAAQLRAAVKTSGDLVSSNGFRPLAGYIFGGNKDANGNSTRIAMTKPVVTYQHGNHTEMVFILPSIYTDLKQLPVPNDENVKLVAVKPYLVAVAGASGRWTMKNVKELEELLREAVKKEGKYTVKPKNMFYARYDPPIKFPWSRRNEVWLSV
jgi:hypothetical protein